MSGTPIDTSERRRQMSGLVLLPVSAAETDDMVEYGLVDDVDRSKP